MPEHKQDYSTQDMAIYEVKDERPELPLPRELNPALPEIPGVFLFLMKCKSGKSNMIFNLLSREGYYADIFDKVVIISPTVKIDKSSQHYFREEVKDLYEIHDDVENTDDIIESIIHHQEEFDINDPDNLPPRICLLLDNISGALNRNSLVAHIFSRYRHYNKLDDVHPRAFQIGSMGLYEFDIHTGHEDPDNLLTEEVETEPPQPQEAIPST